MRKYIIILSVAVGLLALPGHAQSKFVFGPDNQFSGFGTFMTEFSAVGSDFGFLTGGGGALLIDRQFYVGGYGMGLSNNPTRVIENYNNDQAVALGMGHGGFWLGYIFKPDALVHFNLGSRIGWGSARWDRADGTLPDAPAGFKSRDDFFIVTPYLAAEVNLTPWFKVGIEGGYRLIQGLDLVGKNDTGLNGGFVGLQFHFGFFERYDYDWDQWNNYD